MRKSMFVISLFTLTLAVAPACATKKFVRTEVGQVNDKVGTMGKSLEETQERVRQNEGKIAEVDTKAGAAQNAATQAQQAAIIFVEGAHHAIRERLLVAATHHTGHQARLLAGRLRYRRCVACSQ